MLVGRAEEYVYSRGFLRDWILSTAIIVVVMVAVSAAYPAIAESSVGDAIRRQLEQLVEKAGGGPLNPLSLMALIILNNVRVALIMALSSPTLVLPVMIEAFQGAAVGYMISAVLHGDYLAPSVGVQLTPLLIHYGLVPHGVVEIPAISLVVAPLIGVGRHGLKKAVVYSLSLLPLTIAMLIVAGVVESTVTIVLILLISIIVAFKLLV